MRQGRVRELRLSLSRQTARTALRARMRSAVAVRLLPAAYAPLLRVFRRDGDSRYFRRSLPYLQIRYRTFLRRKVAVARFVFMRRAECTFCRKRMERRLPKRQILFCKGYNLRCNIRFRVIQYRYEQKKQ